MKLYNKIGMIALAVASLTSCAVNDPFDEFMEIGQELPTVSWELGSTLCTAGNDMSFTGKYYSREHNIVRSEVWALIERKEASTATVKLANISLAYTKTINKTDTARSSQLLATYDHSLAEWDGYEFVLKSTFPTSRTLKTINWNPVEWDEANFQSYFPENYKKEFNSEVVNLLTKDSLYYSDVRKIYINYDFTAEQFAAAATAAGVEFPTETELDVKSDLWFTDTEEVVGKYYLQLGEDGITREVEVPLDYVAPEGVSLYDVYKSAPWVFCRYSDDKGTILYSVRPQYVPVMKNLLETITFEEWIYDNANKNYAISFNRSYKLYPTFKVYDDNNKVGYDTEKLEIELN